VDHLGAGRPWDLDRKIDGLFLFNFTSEASRFRDIQRLKMKLPLNTITE
jgi:glucose-1-phosphate adenylyltransferase